MGHRQRSASRLEAAGRVARLILYKDAGALAVGGGLAHQLAESGHFPQWRIPHLEVGLDPSHGVQVIGRAADQSLVVEGDAPLELELAVVEAEGALHDHAPPRHHLGVLLRAH